MEEVKIYVDGVFINYIYMFDAQFEEIHINTKTHEIKVY